MQRSTPFDPPLPRRAGERLHWSGLRGSGRSLAIAAAAQRFDGLVLVIAPNASAADALRADIAFFTGSPLPDEPGAEATTEPTASDAPDTPDPTPPLPMLRFPAWETLPYDALSPHADIASERLATLYALPAIQRGVLVTTTATLMGRVAPRGFVEANTLMIATGEPLDLDAMRLRLELGGYRCVSQVMEHGEFAVRGSLLDLFPSGAERPYRIDLFDAEVETIRTFDPESQRSLARLDAIRLLPARELPLDPDSVARFRGAWRARFEGNPGACPVYRDVSEGFSPPGVEYWLPLFFERTDTLFDYLPEDTLVVELPGVGGQAEAFWDDTKERHEQRADDLERPILAPRELFLPPDELAGALRRRARVLLSEEEEEEDKQDIKQQNTEQSEELKTQGETDAPSHARGHAGGALAPPTPPGPPRRSRVRGHIAFATSNAPSLPAEVRAEDPFALFRGFRDRFPGRILLLAESPGRQETLLETLNRHALRPRRFRDWAEFTSDPEASPLGITLSPVETGVLLDEPSIALLPEALLFGRRAAATRRHGRARDPETVLRDLTELAPGDPVVHDRYGIGRYRGLVALAEEVLSGEFLHLEYADGDQLYVPILSLHLISRYAGAENPPLHKLGSQQWQKARRAAAEKVRDVAAELLEIQTRRSARAGNPMAFDEMQYAAFAEGFPFEETPDQAAAIAATLRDLRSDRPMDRLVCGDVGFGKTEVAMRAAFAAVSEGWQVAVVVPTTLLAQQHHQTFADRFADWPMRIEQLSRLRTARELGAVVRELGEGRVDIVIGTHRLLQGDVRFRRLGLLIVDEEHRFGVRQKERLKALRAEVDILTLSATPIPRTLNMALSSLRDLSLIATAPERRLSIRTFVGEWRPEVIRESILREIRRGGQVYFVHNRVEDIAEIAHKVEIIVPEAEVRVAHGQMRELELEEAMLDFHHRRFNVLVCTTIIESGIDVPNANTIIINRADRFGLAQLHQLRGRVGRSHQRAYAYLFAPDRRGLGDNAVKRLEAIAAMDDLGIGFSLAMHDLEIRGAGELLGEEQSGEIEAVGYSLYTQMLQHAVSELRAGRIPALDRPLDDGIEIDLRIPALIPEDYLPDVHTRLILYKRIASEPDADSLRELEAEIIDRFGPLPPQTKTLLRITACKLRAAPLGIRKIDLGAGGGGVTFTDAPNVDPARIVALLQSRPNRFRMDGGDRLRIRWELPEPDERLAALDEIIGELGGNDIAPREEENAAA